MQENERKEQQAQDISEEMISQENISQEIGEKEPAEDTQEQGLLNITFIPKYMDIFDGLCATDQADGTGKRARMLFVVLVLLLYIFQGSFDNSGSSSSTAGTSSAVFFSWLGVSALSMAGRVSMRTSSTASSRSGMSLR